MTGPTPLAPCINSLMADLRSRMAAPSEEPPFAACSCGRHYTLGQWIRLECLGAQDDGDGTIAPLRNCVCGSTIAPLWAAEERDSVVDARPREAL